MRPLHCYYSRLSQAAPRSIHFTKRMYDIEYLYCCDRVQTVLEGVEILPNECTFPHRAPNSQEHQMYFRRGLTGARGFTHPRTRNEAGGRRMRRVLFRGTDLGNFRSLGSFSHPLSAKKRKLWTRDGFEPFASLVREPWPTIFPVL